ncbi:helicase SNF2 [Enemella evansiae]|uniref:DEAD/DEAH box helicase n=1 Tax=Enemella evansiae TaxID=2016499 RepID=UPI000B96CE40|nr:DEAD/DEAH box helicase [Enemella evansiae]OYN98476.1 helicase SNF2 [Enemella evansiae]
MEWDQQALGHAPIPARGWWDAPTDAELLRRFGELTLNRARAYLNGGRVRSVQVPSQASVVLAEVTGTRRYDVLLTPVGTPDVFRGNCSCPMGFDCKHVLTVLLWLRARPSSPRWRRQLDQLLAIPAESRGEPGQGPLALQVSALRYGRDWAVQFLPTRRVKKGDRWAKNLQWSTVNAPGADQQYRPDQLRALRELAHLHRPYYHSGGVLDFGDLGPGAWRLLGQVRDAGCEFVPHAQHLQGGGESRGVGVDFAELPLGARLARDDDDQVVLGVQALDGTPLESVQLLGNPPTAALVDTGAELVLRPCDPDPGLRPLTQLAQVRIPPEEVSDFVTDYLPRLRERAPVTGAEQVAALPEGETLRLRGTIRGFGTGGIELAWSWVYADATGEREVGLLVERGGPRRSPVVEQELRAALVAELPELAELLGSGSARLDAARAALFRSTVEPRLTADERVELLHTGEVLDYAEATEARVEWQVTDSDERDWFDLGGRLLLDGERVPLVEVIRALRAHQELLVSPSGRFVRLDSPELVRLAELLEEANLLTDRRDELRISRDDVALWRELADVGVIVEQAERWRRTVGALVTADSAEVPPPVGLLAELRPYQLVGYQWLHRLWSAGLGGLLADDMGLGKTLQTLAALLQRRQQRTDEPPALVVAPTSVLGTWAGEAARFTPGLRVVVIDRTLKASGAELAALTADADLVVTSYTLLRLDDQAYAAHDWSVLVLDEAQAVKNPRARTHQAVRRLRREVTMAVTGTPVENSLVDLWAQLALVAPGLYPKLEDFNAEVRRPIESGRKPELMERLRNRIRPLLLRRTKELVAADLPEKHVQVLSVPLAPGHRRRYDRQLARERQRMLGLLADPDANRIEILAGLTRLRQLAIDEGIGATADEAGGRRTPHSAKTETLVELVTELAGEGHRALVFSQFTSYLARVREALTEAGIACCYLDGTTRDRQRVVQEFRDGDQPVFLISLKAGGVGLTLTEADYVFVLDPWWNPAAEQQAIDRAHRIGQRRAVLVYRLVSADTIEEKVVALGARKTELAAGLLGSGDEAAPKLTAEELESLLE